MVQKGLWESVKYRCCITENEIDTFHIRYCNNTTMIEDYKIIFDAVFNIIESMECSKEVKEMILCSLLE